MNTILARQVARVLPMLALALVMLVPAASAMAGVRDDRPNLVGGEVLGRGFVITANYEHFFTNHFGIGGGVMGIGTSGGTVGIMPLYASFLSGDQHSLYLAGGAALVGGAGELQEFRSTWLMQGTIGYQFQAPSGFFVRPIFTINQATSSGGGGFLVWPGFTIGGSF